MNHTKDYSPAVDNYFQKFNIVHIPCFILIGSIKAISTASTSYTE